MAIRNFKGRRAVRGSILLLTMFFMILISLFAVAFWKIVPVELHAARRHKDDTRAYFAADAGIVDTIAYLGAATTAGNVDQIFADTGVTDGNGDRVVTRTGNIDGVAWRVTITPGPGTYGYRNTASPNPIRVYKIEATALFGTTKYRQVTTWVSQDSFAKRNWFPGQGANGNALNLNFQTFKLGGDYHTNDYLRLNIPSNFWNNANPAVGGQMTSAVSYTDNQADGIIYNSWNASLLPYDPANGASIPGRYEKISALGRPGVQTGIGEILLPASTDSVGFGTWGGTPPAPGTQPANTAIFGASGPNIRINGATPGGNARNGLYIEGDVNQIDLSVVNQNQQMRISQGTRRVDVTFVTNSMVIPATPLAPITVNGSVRTTPVTYLGTANSNQGYTVLRKVGTNEYTVYNEQTNGAVFVTGDIRGVRGTTKGRRTLATMTGDGNAGADDRRININGPLLYAGTTAGAAPISSADQLGLISYAVKMESSEASAAPILSNVPTSTASQDGLMWPKRNTTSPTNPMYLYCSIFAGRNNDSRRNDADALNVAGGFGVENAQDQSQGPGHMKLYGSITEGVRLIKGQFDSGTGNGISGYSYNFQEDPFLKQIQPPFFPTLPKYKVISWEEKSVFAY